MEEITAIQRAFSDLIFYHAFFSAFFALPFTLNLYNLFTYKNFASLNKKIWYSMPLIFFLLSIAFLSGINVSITQSNFVNPMVLAMWGYWIFVFAGEIIRLKLLKIARRIDEEAMLKYVRFCKTLYMLNLLGFALLYFGSK